MSTQALEIIPQQKRELILSPVMDLELAKSRMEQFQQFVQYYLEPSQDGGMDGGDYGPIPGAGKKKVLLKSGADKLCELYGLYDEYIVEPLENFETKIFYYKITCVLKNRRDDSVVGMGLGSCSTYESKYRWRDSQRICPKCQAETIIKGKDEFGGGWLCWTKKGGCGQKFKDGDPSIEGQRITRVENPDIMDTVNTVLKMAKKRAKIDAVIGVTRSSGIFTQDLEDVPMPPAKPPVERTETDIPIEPLKSAPANKGQDGNNLQEGKNPSDGAEKAAGTVPTAPAVAMEGCIDEALAANFYREFRNALPAKLRKQADELAHDWLRHQNIKDVLGKPSAMAIHKDSYYDVREAAVQYAKSYQL